MVDREKVIDDLEEQIAWIRDNDFHKFPGWGHAVLAMRDALALLKEQGARVMTLEEVEQEKVMWLETNNHEWDAMNGIHETVLRTDDDRYDFSDIIVQFVDQEGCEIICARDRFGIEWRCWTSCPSDEVRRATPWE